ncbi:MarR family transcriptional regulator [Candidatus Woesearchaeota archaeon]|nr:MarR family transcriptional regulator [Candidatus Woesearchaeota archaeon]
MENKYAGYMLLGISIFIIILILLFNSTMRSFVDETCSLEHGLSCPMYEAISKQTYLALGVTGLLVIVSFVLVFSKPQKEVVIQTKTIEKTIEKKAPKKVFDISELKTDEKQVFELIKENKAVFQADLIEKTGFGKAKMTRIIDRLEGKGFVERKRRGMTNVVVLKE